MKNRILSLIWLCNILVLMNLGFVNCIYAEDLIIPTELVVNESAPQNTNGLWKTYRFKTNKGEDIKVTISASSLWNTDGISDGSYTLRLIANDISSNRSTASVGVNIDNTPPIARITFPEANSELSPGTITICGIADDLQLTDYSLEYGIGDNPVDYKVIATGTTKIISGTLASIFLEQGRYTLRLRAVDRAKNIGSCSVAFVVIEPLYSEPGLPERYVGRVVLKAGWGKGPGECGVSLTKEEDELGNEVTMRLGPYKIEVDKEENIYVGDIVNRRIHKYDPNGNYLFTINSGYFIRFQIDKNGDIYVFDDLLDSSRVVRGKIIKRFNDKGEYITTYQIYGYPIPGLYIENGKIVRLKENGEIDICEIIVKTEGKDNIVLDESKFKPEKLPNSMAWATKKGEDFYKLEEGRIMEIYTVGNHKGIEAFKRFKIDLDDEYYAFIENVDDDKNIFLLITVHPAIVGKVEGKYEICKYNEDGKLLLKVKLVTDGWASGNDESVCPKGNIYQLVNQEEGVYVIKWEKVKK